MIRISNLQKIIEGNTVVDILALNIPKGEIVAVVGPAGSGKQDFFDLVIGKSQPSLGQIKIAGLNPYTERDSFTRKVGVLFEEDGLYERQSALENLIFNCQLYGLPRDRAELVLAQIGLGDHARMRTDKLASGMKRRLAFGRAILHEPEVLILIEPFARCDQGSLSFISQLIRQFAQEGVTILILANDTANLLSICRAIYLMDGGQIVESQHPQDEPAGPKMPFKVPVRLEGRVALINPADILFADVEDGKACVQTGDGRLTTQFTLSELEERLGRSGFFRAHRSYLVNLQHVKEVIPYTRDSYTLLLDDGANTEIPLSKSAANELRDLLGY
ncbi:MAG: LytTR family transcriptional regulator DNA-binding domain-containing protein [Anaerolineales bacterium]|nr:LytTR family transcriptional regulator DNA-binding domain-containing protein [Anaerolineales bacterium]